MELFSFGTVATRARQHIARPVAVLLILVGGAGIAVGFDAAGASASAKAPSATVVNLLGSAKKAILAHSSVHISSTGHNLKTNKLTETTVSDEGTDQGEQTIVSGTLSVAIRFTPKAAFFSGNSDGLTTVFGMPTDDVAKVGSKWVMIPKSNAAYPDFDSTEIRSLPKEVLPTTKKVEATIKVTKGESEGQKVDILAWSQTQDKTKVTFKLDLSATGNGLPVSETQISAGTKDLTTFTHWNEHVAVETPKHTIAYSSLSSS